MYAYVETFVDLSDVGGKGRIYVFVKAFVDPADVGWGKFMCSSDVNKQETCMYTLRHSRNPPMSEGRRINLSVEAFVDLSDVWVRAHVYV